jgi:uncharacterized zinc-type alcohol dehydrogenase-like protein
MTIEHREPGLNDVAIDIAYAGICHTDVHQIDEAWGGGIFPMVPGHEITGVVQAVGPGVTKFRVGDRVGVGTYIDSCRECENCVGGFEVYCTGPGGVTPTYNSRDRNANPNHGGYSKHIVVDERYVVRIPNELGLDVAAPLLCAGITTYSALKHWNVGAGTNVAVLGMGGLGHVAVSLAHALGAQVTVLSRTLNKRDDGLALGADHYYATADPRTFTELAGTFDIILCTISDSVDFDRYLSLLRLDGTLINVGAPEDPITLSNWSLITGRRSYASSGTGGMPETQEMLDFCAQHKIAPMIETIRADQINEGFDRLRRADVRYRFVIDAATL